MSKEEFLNNGRDFKIRSWPHAFIPQNVGMVSAVKAIPAKIGLYQQQQNHSVKNFFIPEWSGDNLPSKDFMNLVRSAQHLFYDAKKQYEKTTILPRSLKKAIYDEFLRYADSEAIESVDFHSFWDSHTLSRDPSLQNVLDDFKNVYCFRLVTVYIHKIKFILTLKESVKFPVTENFLLNPNSLLSRIFKKASSTEINCQSLGMNSYSWYRPSASCVKPIRVLKKKLSKMTASEMIKAFHYDHFTSKEKQSIPLRESQKYSHSLSHTSFGLFLNSLLTCYPKWFQKNECHSLKREVLKTKFVGASIDSFSLSHWPAREVNMHELKEDILLPSFVDEDGKNILYANICSELQFLTLLANMAQVHNYNAVKFICSSLKDENLWPRMNLMDQMHLPLEHDEIFQGLIYKRIVLYLPEVIKRNPHHHLITNINRHKKVLDKNGFMIVLTNQKLFLPGQADRMKVFLKEVKIHSYLNFEKLEGKGEIPNFFYVLSKRDQNEDSAFGPSTLLRNDRESLLTFNISGELFLFKNFKKIADEFKNFLHEKTPYTTPVYRNEINQSLLIEHHQDAIIGGRVLSSINSDNSNITHPKFFKGLTKFCTTFDQFFLVEHLKHNKRFDLTGDLLGHHYTYQDKYLYVLVIDFSRSTKVSLEIIHSYAYNARLEKYGTACFEYYGLLAKIPDININIFREFFNTEIGQQIIQLSLNGPISNLKSKINALLIPKFFSHTNFPSKMDQQSLAFMESPTETLMSAHPNDIGHKFLNIQKRLSSLENKYPWYILGLIIHFKNNCREALEVIDGKSTTDGINYNNPLIIDKITGLKTYSIFDNPDIYVEFYGKNELTLPFLTLSSFQKEENTWKLEIKTQVEGEEKIACVFYAEAELIQFLSYILEETIPKKPIISFLLQGLQIPRAAQLKEALNSYTSLKASFQKSYKNSQKIISNIFVQQIV